MRSGRPARSTRRPPMLRTNRPSPSRLSRALFAVCKWILVLSCLGAAASCDYPGAVSPRPAHVSGSARGCGARPVECDRELAEEIGRRAVHDLGYAEILRLAYEARLIRFVKRPGRTAAQAGDGNLMGQVVAPRERAGELDPAPLKRAPPTPVKRRDERAVAEEMAEVAV